MEKVAILIKKFNILKKTMGNISVIYKENNSDFYAIVCKNQTCSDKLRELEQINKYLDENVK